MNPSSAEASSPSSALMFADEAERITHRHRVTLLRWSKRGLFPQPLMINGRRAWPRAAVERWLAAHLAQGQRA